MFGWARPRERRILEAKVAAAEKREAYTQQVLTATLAAAEGQGKTTAALATAAVEVAAAKWSAGFMMFDIEPVAVKAYFPRQVLAWIGRRLLRTGDVVLAIDPVRNMLIPAHTPLVTGGADPSTWRYEIEQVGPTGSARRTYGADQVLHVQYGTDPAMPWQGIGPLAYAETTAVMVGGIETGMSQEANANTGYVVPVPQEGGTTELDPDGNPVDPLAELRKSIAELKGRTGLVESTAAGWGQGRGQAPQTDWKSQRIGADPPETLLRLRDDAYLSILAACGIPPSLVGHGGAAQANREAWRQFLHGTLAPLGALLADEASRKFGTEVSGSFDQLFASDLQGRARAFQSMVGGGMEVERAAALSGLLAMGGV